MYGVQFRPGGALAYFSSPHEPFALHDQVVVGTEQGESLGTVVRVCEQLPDEARPVADDGRLADGEAAVNGAQAGEIEAPGSPVEGAPGEAAAGGAAQPARSILRRATEADLARAQENRELAVQARSICREQIRALGLEMKLVDVEVLLDRSKYVFYFTSPGRVDFRELVKDLVRRFHTRIELRQIGVRNETQMIGGIGNCGMPCCCRRYIRKFAPVTIKMAKEQNLFLNPAKISGTCGRLLCCLAYEQPNYEDFHGECPKSGKKFATARGPMKVLRANFFRRTLSVLNEHGEEEEIGLDEWERLKAPRPDGQKAPGATAPEAAAPPPPDQADQPGQGSPAGPPPEPAQG